MLVSTGGRPYENKTRQLMNTYNERHKETLKRLNIAKESGNTKTVTRLMEISQMERHMIFDLYQMMKICGYLLEDETKPVKVRAENPY